jgi:hypothetical protein
LPTWHACARPGGSAAPTSPLAGALEERLGRAVDVTDVRDALHDPLLLASIIAEGRAEAQPAARADLVDGVTGDRA